MICSLDTIQEENPQPKSANQQRSVLVKVELFGFLRQLTGSKELEVRLTVPTVAELTSVLCQTHGKNFSEAVMDPASGEFMVLVLVNGDDIDFLEKSRTLLANGDTVTLIPLSAGG